MPLPRLLGASGEIISYLHSLIFTRDELVWYWKYRYHFVNLKRLIVSLPWKAVISHGIGFPWNVAIVSVKVICSPFYLWSNFQVYLFKRENTWFFALLTSLVIYLGQDDFVPNEPFSPAFFSFFSLALQCEEHAVVIIARPTPIICFRSKSNTTAATVIIMKTTAAADRDSFGLSCSWNVFRDRAWNRVPFQKCPRWFFSPFSIKILPWCLQNPGQLPNLLLLSDVSGKAV